LSARFLRKDQSLTDADLLFADSRCHIVALDVSRRVLSSADREHEVIAVRVGVAKPPIPDVSCVPATLERQRQSTGVVRHR